MSSPLKWAGSKRKLVPFLDIVYTAHRHRRLVEPFVGSMAVALGLQPERALLADLNEYLINFYLRLRDPSPFTIKMECDEKTYYSHRDDFNFFNANGDSGLPEVAELFYYLNKTCFNGLCRSNKKGEFNVPFGKYKSVNYRRDFSEYAELLNRWTITHCRFDDVSVEPDDFVYLDPPYDTDFTEYSGHKFTWEDQVRLAEMFVVHPGPVVASNQATSRVLDLYHHLGYDVRTTEMPRSISSDGDRTPALEMIATRNIDWKGVSAI